MESTHVSELIQDVLTNLERTIKKIEEDNQEIDTLQHKCEEVMRYDTRFYYTEGFWGGFMFGAVLMTSVITGMIYALR